MYMIIKHFLTIHVVFFVNESRSLFYYTRYFSFPLPAFIYSIIPDISLFHSQLSFIPLYQIFLFSTPSFHLFHYTGYFSFPLPAFIYSIIQIFLFSTPSFHLFHYTRYFSFPLPAFIYSIIPDISLFHSQLSFVPPCIWMIESRNNFYLFSLKISGKNLKFLWNSF